MLCEITILQRQGLDIIHEDCMEYSSSTCRVKEANTQEKAQGFAEGSQYFLRLPHGKTIGVNEEWSSLLELPLLYGKLRVLSFMKSVRRFIQLIS